MQRASTEVIQSGRGTIPSPDVSAIRPAGIALGLQVPGARARLNLTPGSTRSVTPVPVAPGSDQDHQIQISQPSAVSQPTYQQLYESLLQQQQRQQYVPSSIGVPMEYSRDWSGVANQSRIYQRRQLPKFDGDVLRFPRWLKEWQNIAKMYPDEELIGLLNEL